MGRSCINSLSDAFLSDTEGHVLPRETQELVFEHTEGKRVPGNDSMPEGRAGRCAPEAPVSWIFFDLLPTCSEHLQLVPPTGGLPRHGTFSTEDT